MSITFHATNRGAGGAHRGLLLGLCGLALLVTPAAQAANLPGLTVIGIDHTVKCPQNDPTCNQTTLTAYRWLVEEDRTYHVQTDGTGVADPAIFDPNWPTTLSVSFHKSYMPVVAKGCVGFGDLPLAQSSCDELGFSAVPQKYYYVSVLPRDGYTIGGAAYDPAGTTVYVYKWPIPTAQISILVFEDNFPINNAPDLPAEDPANPDATDMSGFQMIVEDAGGRYGASAGIASQDAFGNPLCTEYQYIDTNGNGVHDTGEPYVPGLDGLPIVTTLGTGCRTDANGRVLIKHLAPGKYGIQAVPPGPGWQQTSTIEGTKVIDAWVKANEPPFFAEFGPVGFHVFIGFVKQFDCFAGSTEPNCQGVTPGVATISGKVVNMHLSRPPDYAFYMGACFGHTTPWVGLNDLSVGIGKAIYVAPTDDNCNFSIANVPDGNYQLALFDNNLDLVFGFKGISIVNGQCSTPSGSCNLGDVPLFQWFTRMEHHVYYDLDGDGFPDDGEPPMLEQNVNLRWRDGTVYQAFPTDAEGVAPFDQVFPFFSWQVAEVDFARYEATGVTISVDNGGAIPAPPATGPDWTAGRHANPQDQTNPGDSVSDVLTADYRTEKGPVLTQGFQGFLGQTTSAWWGKRHYADGENGGISGIVFYATTRAENDPRYAVAEVWEPGIPNVKVNLYDATGTTLLATTFTDSWDDSLPTECQYGNDAAGPFTWTSNGGEVYTTDCYDGLRNFNQVRPAVFDGGYAFGPEIDCPGDVCPSWVNQSAADPSIGFIKPGEYVVEVIPPPGYDLTKPEDKNVDFGDEYFPSSQLLPPPCVGPLHIVPPALTLYPDGDPDEDGLPGITAPFAGQQVPLCNKKLVTMSAGANAAADFFLHTEVPIASHAIGFILDDTQNEFDPNSPQFGEKYAPPFVPVAIRDWTGREIGRTLSDQYGRYNFLAPSTSTANLPMPSGVSPNMLTTCMNDKTLPDGSIDPNHNPIYSQFCYTFQYMPGATVYLDTPVVPVGAFAGPDQFPLDCEFPDGTPRVWAANGLDNGAGGGPYLPTASGTLVIDALGPVEVPNPFYCNPSAVVCPPGSDTTNATIPRDYGFGAIQGDVFIGDVPAPIVGWTADQIQVTVTPVMGTGGQLRIVRGDNGRESINAVTVQIGLRSGAVERMVLPAAPGDLLATPIQDAIDIAGDNDLILVQCGSYSEMVVMWKPVQLQGAGECTTINAVKAPPDKLALWRGLVDTLLTNGDVDLLPGQEQAPGNPEPTTLMTEEGAGVLVLARAKLFEKNPGARIDGFRITGADTGGGVILNGYGTYVEVSNNRLENNQGVYGGGIRVGHPTLVHQDGNTLAYTDAVNDFVNIHHNHVVRNGGLGGAGGGISMCTGADSYRVTDNYVCGNFNTGNGGGIGHIGLSTNEKDKDPMPLIADNTVIFNEIFNQGVTVSGGGLFIGGAPPLAIGTLSPGAGNVQVIGNLVQGNSAGAGDGGGARLVRVNGQDVADNKKPEDWFSVDLFNNIFVNNVAALAGGGVSLQDAVRVRLVHNTIAHNDSTATASEAFTADPNMSTPQPGAGIVSRTHSTELKATGKAIGTFSDPEELADNIVWHNRQFYFKVVAANTTGEPSIWGLCPQLDGQTTLSCAETAPMYDDLGVAGAGCLSPTSSILTDLAEDAPDCSYNATSNNLAADPRFVAGYVNGADFGVLQPEINTAIQAPAAFDEGGNFIRIKFGPLSINVDVLAAAGIQVSDYHLLDTSPALEAGLDLTGLYPELAFDFDDEGRPFGSAVDIGADEVQSAPAGNQGEAGTTIVREPSGTRRVGGGA